MGESEERSPAISHRLQLWAPVAIYMALIFGLSSISSPPDLSTSIGDKGGHGLLYFGLPLAIYLLRNYMAGLPKEILESARIDGASHFKIFTSMILPLSFPALASENSRRASTAPFLSFSPQTNRTG